MVNSSKMLKFEGMKRVFEKILILKFFGGNPLYMDPRDYKYHFPQYIYNKGGGRAF